MSKRVDRAKHGPSWAEVILGAALSIVLGAVLGATLLVLRPVSTVREYPKEPAKNTVYFVEGSRDGSKAQALAKRRSFIEGQSISLSEQDLNALVATAEAAGNPAPAKGDKKGAEKKAEEKPADGGQNVTAGTPNFRIADGKLQVGVPVTLSIGPKVLVQARGGFVKSGDMYVFEPETILFGSCPVERLPFLNNYLRTKFTSPEMLPEDMLTAWKKLASVTIQGKTLKLTMP